MKSIIQKYINSYLSYFLMYNFYYLSWALFSALISVYLMDKGFVPSEVSLVVSMSYLVSMITQPIIGAWNDKYDIKKVNTILFIIAAMGSILLILSNHLITIAMTYSLVLMGINGINPVMEKIATASPYSYGKIRIWGTIGYALGTQIAGLLYEKISPESMFIAFVFAIILCIIGLLGTRADIKPRVKSTQEKISLLTLFKNKKYLYYLLICAIFYGATNMSHTFIPSMLVNKGLEASVVSTILSFAVFFEAPLILFSNKFMDKLANKTLLVISLMLTVIQFAVYAFDLPMFLMIFVTFIAKHPAGMLFIMINLKIIQTIVDDHHQMMALALVATLKNLVSIIFQNIAGNILDVSSYATLYFICTIFMLIGLALVLAYKIPSGNDQKLFS